MSGVAPLPARWSTPARSVFVGRRAELGGLEELWTAVQGGARQAAFVGGEPGAGKSRLVAEVCRLLHRQGATVLLGSCVPEFGPPYQPFVEPLEQLLAAGVLDGPAGERLARLAGREPDPRPGAQGEPEYRRELYEAAAAALAALAECGPLVLALEDVQWAGSAGVQLLAHVVERTAECPILYLVTHRTTAPDRSAALVAAIARLYRLEGVRRVDLAGLDTEDIAEYLVREGRLPLHRARVAAAVLRDRTGGNPFLLRELWRDVAAGGGSVTVRELQTPASVRDTVEGRLDRLEPAERQTVELAAVVGDEVDTAIVLAVSDWGQGSTLAALDSACAAGLLEPVDAAGSVLRFAHALTRAAVLELLPATRRALLHARTAEVVQTLLPASERRTQLLAQHFAQARTLGHSGAAVRHLTDAARNAARSLAHEDAAAWFEQAATLTTDPAHRRALLSSAAGSHLLGGNFARARELHEQVAASAPPEERLEAAIGFEAASWRPGRTGHRSVELLTDALRGVRHDPGDARYVRALASLGRALAFTGAAEQAGALGRAALDHARALADPPLLAHALQASLWNGLRPADAPDKLARATELSRLADRIGDLGSLGPAAYYRTVVCYLQGQPDGLVEAHGDLARVAEGTGDPFYEYILGCVRWARQFLVGDFAAARATCTTLLELGSGFGNDDTEGASSVQSYMLRRETGGLEQIRPLLSGEEDPGSRWAPGLLALYTELGLDGSASRVLRWLLDGQLDRYRNSAQWPCVLVFLVEAALRLRKRSVLEELRPMLAEYAGVNLLGGQFVAIFGSADRYLGMLDSALRRPGAEDELTAALEMDVRMGASVHEAATLAALAAHHRDVTGNRRPAEDYAGRARALAEPLGLVRVLGRLGVTRARTSGVAGLTARETEVLRLVGEGLPNREISDRLVISENTVANHVRSILIKTGAGNRTQAAMYAAERGLLGGPRASAGPRGAEGRRDSDGVQ